MEKIQLPLNSVKDLMKNALESEGTTKVPSGCVKIMSKLAGLFTMYLGSTSMDVAKEKGLKTIKQEHVFQALTDLGFANYIDVVKEAIEEHKKKGETVVVDEEENDEGDKKAIGLDELDQHDKIEYEDDNDDQNME